MAIFEAKDGAEAKIPVTVGSMVVTTVAAEVREAVVATMAAASQAALLQETNKNIQPRIQGIKAKGTVTYPHLACVNAIGNLESQVSRAWSHTHVSGKISFSQDLRIEDLTSSIRNTTRT